MINLTSQELLTLKLDVEPVAKGRPRLARSGHVYTPAATSAYERDVGLLVAHLSPLEGALAVEVVFICRRPKATKGAARQLKTTRPDADNLLKSLLDGLNGRLFHDDAQLVDVRAVKLLAGADEAPHVEIKVSRVSL
jgi:Holliday junction resolvase RusA-like endonuclease